MKSRAAGSALSRGGGKSGSRVSAYGGGRVCAAPGCTTVLSTYNPGHCCALHDGTCPAPASASDRVPQANAYRDPQGATPVERG
jgi:hypothetical protein